jgi:hypothetical protein
MSNLRNASLILKTSDLTANSITSIGESNQYMTKMTWYNINIRTLLGDMYDDYDQFNLCLNTFASAVVNGGAGVVGASLDDRALLLKMSGLPFLNQTYDVAKGHNTSSTYMGSIYFTTTYSSWELFFGSNIATFGKNQDLVNITITYERILDGALPTTANAFPSSVFIFDIIGIEKDKGNKNTSRLDNNLNTYF